MKIEEKLTTLGLELPSLEDLYRSNASGAHYISHFSVQNLLYLSGTTPRKNGEGYLAGLELRVHVVQKAASRTKPDRGIIKFRYELSNARLQEVATMTVTEVVRRRESA